jgi:type III pantothenate kinase
MELLIDVGNTRIKWAQFLEDELMNFDAASYIQQSPAMLFNQIWQTMKSPNEVWISCVGAQPIKDELVRWINENWHCPVHFAASTPDNSDVKNGYENPQQLGVDRWLALVAARTLFSQPVCIFDCGTAITLDILMPDGKHLGGLIFPGLKLLQNSVAQQASLVTNNKEIYDNNQLVANNTEAGLSVGGFRAALAILTSEQQRVKKEIGDNVVFVITGGDAEVFIPHLTPEYHYLPNLVLQGLAIIAKNNEK